MHNQDGGFPVKRVCLFALFVLPVAAQIDFPSIKIDLEAVKKLKEQRDAAIGQQFSAVSALSTAGGVPFDSKSFCKAYPGSVACGCANSRNPAGCAAQRKRAEDLQSAQFHKQTDEGKNRFCAAKPHSPPCQCRHASDAAACEAKVREDREAEAVAGLSQGRSRKQRGPRAASAQLTVMADAEPPKRNTIVIQGLEEGPREIPFK